MNIAFHCPCFLSRDNFELTCLKQMNTLKYTYVYCFPFIYMNGKQYYSSLKRKKILVCDTIDELGGYYAKWNKSDT